MFLATFVFWMGRHEFVHVPPNPGGKLGFLDAVVGFCLFVPLFMILFAQDSGLVTMWQAKVGISVAAVVVGMMVFSYRQRVQEDDGFLAILVYSCQGLFKKNTREVGSPGSKADPDAAISKHWFFGPAAGKYGSVAAEGPLAVFRIVSVFFLVSVFWMLFDQHATTWVEQAKQMDRMMDFGVWSWSPLPSQVSAVNPIMVMILIPLLTFGLFPALERWGLKITPLRKMSVGMMIAGTAFIAVALIQAKIEDVGEGHVSIWWQMIPYALMTTSEVLVSITGLEFAYTQAPKRMKSIVMSFWLLCVSFGNYLVAKLSHAFEGWPLSKGFWIFAGLMFAAGALFSIRALFYTYKEYPQE